VQFVARDRVCVTGLIGHSEFNECVGTIVGQLNRALNRYPVSVVDRNSDVSRNLWLRPENLRPFIASSEAQQPSTLAQQIDAALGLYYARMNRGDYYGKGGKEAHGLFFQFCEDNELDDDEVIREEIAENAGECSLTDFTEDFPIAGECTEPIHFQIFQVLQNCYRSTNVDPMRRRSPTALFPSKYVDSNLMAKAMKWELSADAISRSIRVYDEAADEMFSAEKSTHKGFLYYALALGRENGRFPWMQFLRDIFSRESMHYHRDSAKILQFAPWFATQCSAKGVVLAEAQRNDIEKAMEEWTMKRCPQMISSINTVIDDALEPIVEHLIGAYELVQSVAHCAPFQFELVIACDAAQSKQNALDGVCEDESLSSDDQSFDTDMLGDVVGCRLRGNGLRNVTTVTLAPTKIPRKGDVIDFERVDAEEQKSLLRLISTQWLGTPSIRDLGALSFLCAMRRLRAQSVRRALDDLYGDGGVAVITDIICEFEFCERDIGAFVNEAIRAQPQTVQSAERQRIGDAFREFVRSERNGSVRGRRVCLLLDLRRSDYQRPQNRFCDALTFYAPPKGADAVRASEDGDVLGERFSILISQKCLIARVAYSDGAKDLEAKLSALRLPQRQKTLTALSPNPKVLTFSFHALRADAVRCDLYRER